MPKWLIYALIILVAAAAVYFLIPKKAVAPTPAVTSNNNNNANTMPVAPASSNPDYSNKKVTLKTTMGDIAIEFYNTDAPLAVENFIRLAESGYYKGVIFHRVIRDFMIQSGDPTGIGRGGESAFGKNFADELNPATESYKAGYKKGVVAMANKGPNTNGSQFFIMLIDRPLDHLYTIFGHVTAGQDVVDKIGNVITDPETDRPINDVVINQVVVSEK